jgi:hypothetical protein
MIEDKINKIIKSDKLHNQKLNDLNELKKKSQGKDFITIENRIKTFNKKELNKIKKVLNKKK